MRILAFLLIATPASSLFAWSESGHHIIANMAFDLLTAEEQGKLLTLLKAHPRFDRDFRPPEWLPDQHHQWWQVGRSGYWPDIARSQPEFNRPKWHYQLGATLVIGEEVQVPSDPGPLPDDANMTTEELHLVQAITLCRAVLADSESSATDKALAVCWLAHLVGDSHQPCHAGSLYVANAFPKGDRGANRISTRQADNLHALWDQLLGNHFEAGDVRRRIFSITSDPDLVKAGETAVSEEDGLDPMHWIRESRKASRTWVYTPEVLAPVVAKSRGFTQRVGRVDLTDAYLSKAGQHARLQASRAAHRLAAVWKAAL